MRPLVPTEPIPFSDCLFCGGLRENHSVNWPHGGVHVVCPGFMTDVPIPAFFGGDLHYGLMLDEHRVVEPRDGHGTEDVLTIGVQRNAQPALAVCATTTGAVHRVPIKDLVGQCNICGRRLDPTAGAHDAALDCGGDCNACVAEAEGRPL